MLLPLLLQRSHREILERGTLCKVSCLDVIADSHPAIVRMFKMLYVRNSKRGGRWVPRKLFNNYRRVSKAKQIERIRLASLARRCGRTRLYDEGRVSVNVISLRMTGMTDMQVSGKKQISAAISEPRHRHPRSSHQIALVVAFGQIKWVVSHNHFNDVVC